jgi:exosortase
MLYLMTLLQHTGTGNQQVAEASAETADAQSLRKSKEMSWWVLGGISVLALLVYAPTVLWLWDRWTLSVWQHGHGLLVPPVVGYLVWKELKQLRDVPASASAWGFAILVPALALHVLDTGMHTQLLSAASLFLTLPGFSLLFLGTRRTKAILFPLAFLFLTLPIPLAATGSLNLALRKLTTAGAAEVIPRLGIPLFVEKTTLHLPNGSMEVADACSGFSTLYASLAIAGLMAYSCPDPRRRILVLLAAGPIAIAANIIRIVLLAVLVSWQGMGILGTRWHVVSGLFTFVLALPMIIWLGHAPDRPEGIK